LKRIFNRTMALFAIVALAACQGGSTGGGMMPQSPGASEQQQSIGSQPSGEQPVSAQPNAPASDAAVAGARAAAPAAGDGEIPITAANAVRPVCPRATRPGEKECYALERADLRASNTDPNSTHQGYGPSDLQSAYNITGGRSSLVAIVDAFGYPRASADLANYRSYYKLPACTTGNGCLKIRNQTGGTNPPHSDPGWDQEQALDLDMVSAMCPKCKLLLVQANSVSGKDLYTAVSEAAKLGAVNIRSAAVPANRRTRRSRLPVTSMLRVRVTMAADWATAAARSSRARSRPSFASAARISCAGIRVAAGKKACGTNSRRICAPAVAAAPEAAAASW
jgi:hypothetical protein